MSDFVLYRRDSFPVDFVPARVVLGASDAEMDAIAHLANEADLQIVMAASGARDDAYASTVVPLRGDVWIECAPADGGRAAITAAGGVWIDHHQPGDVKPGTPAFAASSVGRFVLLTGQGTGSETGSARGDYGIEEGPAIFHSDLHGWCYCHKDWPEQVGEGVVRTGEADHDLPSFLAGRLTTTAENAAKFLAKRTKKYGVRAATPEEVDEVVAVVATLPLVDGHRDARACADLVPPTLVPGPTDPATGRPRMVQVPGTGGRLGHALLPAAGRLADPVISWGSQGVRPQGRHLGAVGPTNERTLEVLASLGAVGCYGVPGRACGGYVPVGAD